MRSAKLYLGIFLWLVIITAPLTTGATVRINEIAWMGTIESHLCNWIELHNTGDQPIDLLDWALQINDTTREFAAGEGGRSVVGGGEYFLIKRQTASCPDPVPSVPGWSITLGNLPNSGATLRLLRPNGTVADTVVGGVDWSNVGGDNESKNTAQRTDSGWITAEPTPGTTNASTQIETTTTSGSRQSSVTSDRVTDARAPRPQSLVMSDSELAVTILGPTYGYVNQPVTLTASTSGVGDTIAGSLQYVWNLGDMHVRSGATAVEHTYRFPGTYVVTLFVTHGRHEQVARAEITILPTPLAVKIEGEFVHIHNTAPYEIDVSGVVVVGEVEKRFPPRSFIPAHGTVTLVGSELGVTGQRPIMVHDRVGAVLASSLDRSPTVAGETISNPSVPSTNTGTHPAPAVTNEFPVSAESTEESFRFSVNESHTNPTSAPTEPVSEAPLPTTTDSSVVAPTGTQATDVTERVWWPSLLLLLLLVVAAGTLLMPRRSEEVE